MRAEELKEPLRHFEKEIRNTADEVKSGVDSIRKFDPMKSGDAVKPDGSETGSDDSDGIDKA